MLNTVFSKILIVIMFIALAVSGYLEYQNYLLKQGKILGEGERVAMGKVIEARGQRLDEMKKDVEVMLQKIDKLGKENSEVVMARDFFAQKYDLEKSRAQTAEIQLGATKETVGVLEKLVETDPELLKKYSKNYFLNENYEPQKLTKISDKYAYVTDPPKELFLIERVASHLQKMMDDASAAGVDIKILSAYRSFKSQAALKYTYLMTYGVGANKFSADQGYSEHQLGTAVDFTTVELDGLLTPNAFEKSLASKWLFDNAYKYGFILSFPRNNGYYIFEPWHWRYIGVDFATKLHEDNKNFYDLDQRLIDTYLISFFD